jgi:hypothetical protein
MKDDASIRCSSCEKEMTRGFVMIPTAYASVPVRWYAGTLVKGWTGNRGSGDEEYEVEAYRCPSCGRVEFFARVGGLR